MSSDDQNHYHNSLHCTQEANIATLHLGQAHLKEDLDKIQRTLSKIETCLVGNGKPGLKAQWEATTTSANKLWLVVLGSLLVVAAKLIADIF